MVTELFDNIEKVLRYLIPAFVFTILLRHFYPDTYCKYVYGCRKAEFILCFTLLGITIYSIHRIIIEAIIDYFVLKVIIQKGAVAEWLLSIKAEFISLDKPDDKIGILQQLKKGRVKFDGITDFIQKIPKINEEMGRYLNTKCAMIHSVLITAELSVFFMSISKRFNVYF